MESATETVAANIRAEMARSGRRQADLAAHLGKPQQNISDRQRGKTPFTIAEVEATAEFLGGVPLGRADSGGAERG